MTGKVVGWCIDNVRKDVWVFWWDFCLRLLILESTSLRICSSVMCIITRCSLILYPLEEGHFLLQSCMTCNFSQEAYNFHLGIDLVYFAFFFSCAVKFCFLPFFVSCYLSRAFEHVAPWVFLPVRSSLGSLDRGQTCVSDLRALVPCD